MNKNAYINSSKITKEGKNLQNAERIAENIMQNLIDSVPFNVYNKLKEKIVNYEIKILLGQYLLTKRIDTKEKIDKLEDMKYLLVS